MLADDVVDAHLSRNPPQHRYYREAKALDAGLPVHHVQLDRDPVVYLSIDATVADLLALRATLEAACADKPDADTDTDAAVCPIIERSAPPPAAL